MSKLSRVLKTVENIAATLVRIEAWATTVDVRLSAIEQESIEMRQAIINWRLDAPPPVPRVTLTGDITSGVTEADIVAGGKTIILTLIEDTWVAAGAAFNAQRQPIIDKLVSNGAGANGWNNERYNIPVAGVVRTSDEIVTIFMPAFPDYDIAAQEVVGPGAPASALVTSISDLTATSSFTIQPVVAVLDPQKEYFAPSNNPNVRDAPDLSGGTEDAAAITAAMTFHSGSLYWPTLNGGAGIECRVIYREVGSPIWLEGKSLVWDAKQSKYSGSVVHIRQNDVAHEFRLKLNQSAPNDYYKEVTASTWVYPLPIGTVTELPVTSSAMLTIGAGDSGTAEAWHVYRRTGGTAEIDVADGEDYCVQIDGAHHVLLENVDQKNGSILGTRLMGGATDICFKGGEITGWGRLDVTTGFGVKDDSGIANRHESGGAVDPLTARIIVERVKIHSPRYDTNAWSEPTEGNHPIGPSGINLAESAGNHVFRYFEIYSDNGNKFLDGIKGRFNNSAGGFPGPDSDIYSFSIRHCWDDALELEGGGQCVRAWGGYVDEVFAGVATTPVHFGPVEVWRMVFDRHRRNHDGWETAPTGREKVGKNQGTNGGFGDGSISFMNCTTLQSGGDNRGVAKGLNDNSSTMERLTSRNNIFHLRTAAGVAIEADPPPSPQTNDHNHDMTNGTFNSYPGSEADGIEGVTPIYKNGVPAYDPTASTRDLTLAPESRGYREGIYIPNFCANVQAKVGGVPLPDMGAHEKDTAPMQFGVGAFL